MIIAVNLLIVYSGRLRTGVPTYYNFTPVNNNLSLILRLHFLRFYDTIYHIKRRRFYGIHRFDF